MSLSIIRTKFRGSRVDIDRLSKSSYYLHLKLANVLKSDLWDRVNSAIVMRHDSKLEQTIRCQEEKFAPLSRAQTNIDKPKDRKTNTVVNLSSLILDKAIENILEYGLNFAIAPVRIPTKELIFCIEDMLRNLLENMAVEISEECAITLRRAKPPKKNIKQDEANALKSLRSNTDIKILKDDKGNATVIMNT